MRALVWIALVSTLSGAWLACGSTTSETSASGGVSSGATGGAPKGGSGGASGAIGGVGGAIGGGGTPVDANLGGSTGGTIAFGGTGGAGGATQAEAGCLVNLGGAGGCVTCQDAVNYGVWPPPCFMPPGLCDYTAYNAFYSCACGTCVSACSSDCANHSPVSQNCLDCLYQNTDAANCVQAVSTCLGDAG
jgi:hypothetical protein